MLTGRWLFSAASLGRAGRLVGRRTAPGPVCLRATSTATAANDDQRSAGCERTPIDGESSPLQEWGRRHDTWRQRPIFADEVTRTVSQPLPATHPHLMRAREVTPGIHRAEYAARRAALLAAMPPNSVMILPSMPEQFYSMDVPLRYRQHTELSYFSGCQEPHAALVLYKPATGARGTWQTPSAVTGHGREMLFIRPRDAARELWDGPMIGIDDAVHIFGIREVYAYGSIGQSLAEMVATSATAKPQLFYDPAIHSELTRLLCEGMARDRTPGAITDAYHSLVPRFTSPVPLVQPLRVIKSDAELALMRRAAAVTGEAFGRAMERTRAGQLESDLAARIECAFHRIGGPLARPAFPTVVASGANACTLHYVANSAVLRDGDMVMVDAGCELNGYCSDVSRSWPTSGRFDAPQSDVYQLLLETQCHCIERARSAARAGVAWSATAAAASSSAPSLDDLHRDCVRILTSGLKQLGFFPKHATADDAIVSGAYAQYFPHALGHYLGMDTHDTHQLSKSIPLRERMVITVEPGIYIRPDDPQAPAPFRGIGMRVEDDVVIHADGQPAEVLTDSVPRSIADIEALMRCGK